MKTYHLLLSIAMLVTLFSGCKDFSDSNPPPANQNSDTATKKDNNSTTDTNSSNSLKDTNNTSSSKWNKYSNDEDQDPKTKTCSQVPTNDIIGASNAISDAEKFSLSTLKLSTNLLRLSESIKGASVYTNQDYISAMLQLSQDIGAMADRIGTMADKILIMSDDIGFMADRILETQRIQNTNVDLTQTNILSAQKNLESVLK